MKNIHAEVVNKVGIVGGGKAGYQFFELYQNSDLAQIVFVVDINPDAPVVKIARKKGIPVFGTISNAIANAPVDYIIEVTGSERVSQELIALTAGKTIQICTHEMAFLILSGINESNQELKGIVSQEINGIKNEIGGSLTSIDQLVDTIEKLTADMRMLSINARIEAARAGDHGRGFAVVAQEMGRSIDSIRHITHEIEVVNSNIKEVSGKIEGAIKRLNE